jgi:radical SAM protein with 4Fe4S-binding SPASM domain
VTAVPPLPRELQVEVTAACNLRCRMCLVRYAPALDRVEGSLDPACFRRLLDELPDLERLTLQGLGEPLLAPGLLEMVEYACARGIRTGFNTNATLLTPPRAERLVRAGLDWLCISLDGATAATYEHIRDGARFARVRAHVEALVAIERRLGAPGPALSLVFVAMRRNVHELAAVVELAADWGIPKVRVQNLSHDFSDAGPDPSYEAIRAFTAGETIADDPATATDAARHFAAAERVAAARGVTLRLPRLASSAAPRAPGTPGCDWPWRSAYVTRTGHVQPCCMLMGSDRAVMGDAGRDGVAAVWQNAAYTAFRTALMSDQPPDVCRGCSAYRGTF